MRWQKAGEGAGLTTGHYRSKKTETPPLTQEKNRTLQNLGCGTRPTRTFSATGKIVMALALTAAAAAVSSLPLLSAQSMDKAVVTVDDEVTAFTYAPDGRIVFSARRMYKAKKYDLERDDIYVLEQNGKRKKIFAGEKFTLGDKPFTYLIEGFTWSPNGKIVAVQMYTTTVDIDDGSSQDARGLLFLDDQGRILKPGKDPVVLDAQNPLWLRDNQTVVYMTNKDMPLGVYSLQYLNVTSGPAGKAFEGRTFLDAARISGSNSAMAVERDRNMDGPPRIQKLELLSQETQEVATLDEFVGGLSLSPSGTKAAYYLDKEVLEIRDLTAPNKLARMRVGLGVLQWSEDETKILLKRTVEKKSADLVTVAVPPLKAYANRAEIPIDEPTPNFLLHGLTIREYGISPDGRFLGVVLPGKRNLEIYSMR
jgi:dipeptidyl aminopeptidase/acylaminoacyl peptidase